MGYTQLFSNPILINRFFCEGDAALFDQASFALFLIAELKAIEPIYQESSPVLVALDAGYITQLLLSRKAKFNIGLSPVYGVDFTRIKDHFKLNQSHQFIHCLLGGLAITGDAKPAENARKDGIKESMYKIGRRMAPDGRSQVTFGNFSRFFQPKSFLKEVQEKALTADQQVKFHQEHVHLRRFPSKTSLQRLDPFHFPASEYRLRSCKRDYLDKPIPFTQFSKFLSLLKEETFDNRSHYLYPSITGDDGIQVYVYLKANGVEEITEGLYHYHPRQHALSHISSNLSDVLKQSYTPFNRKHFQKARFCLFLIGSPSFLNSYAGNEGQYYALLEAGYIGQLLTDKQAEFDIGICPIGGLRFDRIRPYFKLDRKAELLHSFVGGSFNLSIPENRECLEIGRDGKGQANETSVSDPRLDLALEKEATAEQERSGYCLDMAIIGLSGRYPGAATIEDFWNNIKDGKDSFRELPKEREILWRPYASRDVIDQYIPGIRGGFLEDFDCFDNLLFCISPLEARAMDPQERLFLEVTWECLENSGYTAEKPKPNKRQSWCVCRGHVE